MNGPNSISTALPERARGKLQRLLTMSPAELLFRGRQEAAKTLERLTLTADDAIVPTDNRLGDLRGSAVRGPSLAKTSSPRFFAGVSDDQVPALIGVLHPTERDDIIASADAICRGEFPILGYGRVSFGRPTNWHLDPLTGRRSPLVHWSRVDPLDPEQVGDSKVVWELSRHQWLLDLGQAWRFTGDERYAETFAQELRNWMQHNPPGMGINWSSALEVSMRLIAWSWALFLFRDAQALTAELEDAMAELIALHANHVSRYLSRYFSPNTHLTGEALGLIYAGTLLNGHKEASRWTALGHDVLLQQLQQQVHPDGVYFEQSTRYQYYTVEIYLHFIALSRRNGVTLPVDAIKRVQSMLDFLLALRQPDGSMPQIGDNDGGWLLPLVRRKPGDFSALFATAAVLFGRGDYAWAAGRLPPETLWLLGTRSRPLFAMQHQAPPATSGSLQIFRDGGYAVMRDGWRGGARHMIFDTGPLGCTISGGHGHADLLSIQCSAFGEPYLIDPGTGCYQAGNAWREYFRSTRAHNTITIDGRDQATTTGPFSWQGTRPSARLVGFANCHDYDVVEAEHTAYADLENPVTHRRRVVFVKESGYWIIVDDLTGIGRHRIALRYQFAQLEAAREQSWVRVRGLYGSSLLVSAFATIPLNTHLGAGKLDPASGWISPNYGQCIAAPALTYVAEATLPLRLVTVLYPVAMANDAPPEVTPRFYAPADVYGNSSIKGLIVRMADTEHRIDIDADDISVVTAPCVASPVF